MDNIKKILNNVKNDEAIYRIKKREIELDAVERKHKELEARRRSEVEYKPFSADDHKKLDIKAAYQAHKETIAKRLPFITPELSEHIPLINTKYIVGAISGQGKTTMGAAMTFEVLKHSPDTKVLYLSNEEEQQTFMQRLGCLQEGKDFNAMHRGLLTQTEADLVNEAAEAIQDRVFFVRSEKTGSVNGIMEILNSPIAHEHSMIILDYYQGVSRVNESDVVVSDTDANRALLLDRFKQKITAYETKCPLVILSQLKPLPYDEPSRNVESRIKWGTSLYEAGAFVMEAINIPKANAMELYLAKGRFGGAHTSFKCKFDKGRYISLDDDEYTKHILQSIHNTLEKKASDE